MLTLTALLLLAPAPPCAQDATAAPQDSGRATPPTELHDVERVVDGDTLWILRDGEREKLRLLSVDTEERITERGDISPSKPETEFGEACARWAQDFFAALAEGDDPPRVGLRFPGGAERRDVYGRLLCHVLLPDGTDFNVLLVREGKSPYFVKYGYSRVCHDAFREAEAEARRERRGIWDPTTNAGGKRRPYDRLLPWWHARAIALERFRRLRAEDPLRHVEAEDPAQLEAATREGPRDVLVLGLVQDLFDEDDGSLTVLLRSGDRRRAVRVRLPADVRAAHEEAARFEASREEFVQNYLLVEGRLVRTDRGFELEGVEPSDWRRAGPEPDLPTEPEDSDGR